MRESRTRGSRIFSVVMVADSLSAEQREVVDDVVPRLELVAAELQARGQLGVGVLALDEVVAVEQVALVGEDGVAPGRDVDVFVEPGEEPTPFPSPREGCRIGRGGRTDEIDLIALDEEAHGFLERRGRQN